MEKERNKIERISQQITVEVKRISKRACFCLSTVQLTGRIVSVTTIFHLSRFILEMTFVFSLLADSATTTLSLFNFYNNTRTFIFQYLSTIIITVTF